MHLLYSMPAASLAAEAAHDSGNDFITALVVAIIAAVMGALAARFLKQPLIVGYIFAGMLIGPYTPGPVTSVENVQTLAEIGVALLMFALGTEFSIQEIRHVGKPAVFGGLLQVGLTLLLGIPVGFLLGLNLGGDIFTGGLLALSSTIVMLKVLIARGEFDSRHGKLALGVGIVQDLSLIALVVILPTLGASGGESNLVMTLGVAFLKAGLFLGGSYFIGTKLIPLLLERIVLLGSREVFLLVIIAIALGMAILAQLLGISFALGAFVAGLLVSSSEVAGDVLDEIVPIRDVFASLFFVSIGMLIDPIFAVTHLPEIALLVAAVILGKGLIAGSMLRLFGQPIKTAVLSALLLAQVGEFSFVLARIGVSSNAIPASMESLLLAAALITIVANPFLLQAFPAMVTVTQKVGGLFGSARRQPALEPVQEGIALPVSLGQRLINDSEHLLKVPDGRIKGLDTAAREHLLTQAQNWPFTGHVIVCGFGRVGREIVATCQAREFPVLVIELDQHKVDQVLSQGVMGFFGDATVEATLRRANIEQAKIMAIAIPDLVGAEAVTKLAHRLNPSLEIITRATEPRAVKMLKEAGASEVVQPEFEAGLEFIRRTARAFGMGGVELQGLVNGRRNSYYGNKENG